MKRPLPTHLLLKPVKVYAYTLAHRPGILWYSVLFKGLVEGHAKLVVLENAVFRVSLSGERIARRLQRKSPYALVCGTLVEVASEADISKIDPTGAVPVRFFRNNWQNGFFGNAETEERIDTAQRVILTPELVLAFL